MIKTNKKVLFFTIICLFLLTSTTIVSAINIKDTNKTNKQSLNINLIDYKAKQELNEKIHFEISVSYNNPVLLENYNIYTLPYEKVTIKKEENTILGKFTPTKEGIYSLIIEIKHDGSTTREKYYYIVNPNSDTVKYYFRDINPTHRQPGTNKGEDGDHKDSKALVFEAPTQEMEYWKCSRWVQNSPDKIKKGMPYFSILKSIDAYFWYQAHQASDSKYFPITRMGVERVATWSTFVNRFTRLTPTGLGDNENQEDYSWAHKKISFLYWPMLSNYSWYFISLKIIGNYPVMMTIPKKPSYAEFHYLYYDDINIISNSNSDVNFLSVTKNSEESNDAEIILEGKGETDLKIQMPDKNINYIAKLDNKKVKITQENGEVFFDNLYIDSEESEHILSISKQNNEPFNKQYIKPELFKIFKQIFLDIFKK